MRALLRTLLLIAPMLLAGCDDIHLDTQQYTLVAPPSPQGQVCAQQCVTSRGQCEQSCAVYRANCIQASHMDAQRNFQQYINDRMAQGLLVDKKEADFYADEQNCRTVATCKQGCEINQRTCHENCGGKVLQNGNCLANCASGFKSPVDEVLDWFSSKTDE